MQSLFGSELQREVLNDRLRMAGYQSRVQRRRHERSERVRHAVGARLVSFGQRLQGICEEHAAEVAPVISLPR